MSDKEKEIRERLEKAIETPHDYERMMAHARYLLDENARLRAELADARNLLREAGYVYAPDAAMTEDKTR